MASPGARVWAIPEGYIPADGIKGDSALISHEAACILNAGDRDATVDIIVYFADRDPVGPYRVIVPAKRTLHLRFNDLDCPAPIPRDTDYATVLTSTEPVIVQHTRLDSRDPRISLLSTIAYQATSVYQE